MKNPPIGGFFYGQACAPIGNVLPEILGTDIAFNDLRVLVSNFRRKLVIHSSSL